MCRFVAYSGRDVLMSDLLTRSSRSLIQQSFHARERDEPLNGDGFGVGWYAPDIDPEPGLFTSIRPAWGDRNLIRLASKIRSACIFAHVRAASPGLPITQFNCHPFQYGRFLWMHNGLIAGFNRIKRRLCALLSDELYDQIAGTTDSEHVFALFLHHLGDRLNDHTLEDLQQALRATIGQIEHWAAETGADRPSYLNFALTDGRHIVSTRYATDGAVRPESLYIAQGDRLEMQDNQYRMLRADGAASSVIIASEPLTDAAEDWQPIPANHMVSATPGLGVQVAQV